MSDGNRISILPEAPDSQMTDSALINVAVVDATSSTGFTSKKSPLSRLAAYILNKFTGLSLGGSSQTVKSAIDTLNSKLATQQLGNNPNFDNITENGFYYFSDATSAVNPPNADAGYLNMMVIRNGNMVTQVVFGGRQITQAGRDYIWARYRNGNIWNPWIAYAKQSDIEAIQTNPFPIRRTLTSADDLDSIIESGTYGVESSIPSNVPSDATGSYGMLMVFGGTSGTQIRVFQLYAYTGRALYYRRKFGSASDAWSAWTKVTGTVVS